MQVRVSAACNAPFPPACACPAADVHRPPPHPFSLSPPRPQFTLLSNAAVPNVTAELAKANNYPNIRLFTVGQGNSSTTPFTELASIEQPWVVAANTSVGVGGWSAFSAICWFVYRDLYDATGIPQG